MTGIQERFNKLKLSISVVRDTVLSDEELQSVFLTLPAMLVAHADGVFDLEEKCEIYSICEQLVSDDIAENLRPARVAELYYIACTLVEQNESYIEDILGLIRDEIADQPDSKLLISDMLYNVADSSNGISSVEQTMIQRLEKDLNLKEK